MILLAADPPESIWRTLLDQVIERYG